MALLRSKGRRQPVDINCLLDETPFVVEKETLWSDAPGLYPEGRFAKAAKAFACLLARQDELATPAICIWNFALLADSPAAWDGVLTYDSKTEGNHMRIHLFGIRGSMPVSGRSFVRYGGNTSCVAVELASGRHLLLDCGTGLRAFARTMVHSQSTLPPVLFFSHYHQDHIGGLPYFAPFFRKDSQLALYGPMFGPNNDMSHALQNLFNGLLFPVPVQDIPKHELHDFKPGDSLTIDGVRIETCPTSHPGGAVAYRITADGWTFAYTGDHEIPLAGADTASIRLADFLAGADVVLADGAYNASDHALREGWGHSHFEQWPQLLEGKKVRHIVFAHFDADYDDATVDALLDNARATCAHLSSTLYCGKEGMVLTQDGPEALNDPTNASQNGAACEICDFFQRVASLSDTHTVLGTILQKARELGSADAGTIYLEENGELTFASAQNDTLFPGSAANKFFYLNSRLPLDTSSIAGYVATTGVTLNIPDVYELASDLPFSFNKSFDPSSGYRTKSMLVLPLVNSNGDIKGVLQLINAKQNGRVVPFTAEMEQIIGRLGRMATIPLERAFMTTDMIMRMLHTSALRDPKETAGHVWRVGGMAAELYQHWATAHNVDPEEMLATRGQLRLAAMLHDVGKVAIPDAVLKKPGPLDNAERAIMQGHAAQGASLFRGSAHDIDKMAHDIALHHHAKWDGTGYTGSVEIPSPSGQEIPLFARITAIVDVYDALVSSRCYKQAWDPSQALDILQKDAGSHFDPELVEIFSGIQDVIKAIFEYYREDA